MPWFTSRCPGSRLPTWQMTVASSRTAHVALCGQPMSRRAWYHEPTAATATEPLQLRDLGRGTHSSCTIQTSATDGSDDSWRVISSGTMNTALCDLRYAAPCKNVLLTYLLICVDMIPVCDRQTDTSSIAKMPVKQRDPDISPIGYIPRTFSPPGQYLLHFYMVLVIPPLPSPPSANLQYKAIYRYRVQNWQRLGSRMWVSFSFQIIPAPCVRCVG